jgi:hypothetical protein
LLELLFKHSKPAVFLALVPQLDRRGPVFGFACFVLLVGELVAAPEKWGSKQTPFFTQALAHFSSPTMLDLVGASLNKNKTVLAAR